MAQSSTMIPVTNETKDSLANEKDSAALDNLVGDMKVALLHIEENNVQDEEKKDDSLITASADSGDNPKTLQRSSSSFVRAHDLDIPRELQHAGRNVSSSILHEAMKSQAGRRGPDKTATEGMFFLDQDLKLVLDELVKLGYSEATDEGPRFTPGRETAAALRKRATQPALQPQMDADWPIRPWNPASTRNLNEILIWNGVVHSHKGFGHDWPIVKARGIVPTSPREMVDFLWNSDNVKLYNSMSQGRVDGVVFQENINTLAAESSYGFPGCAKLLTSYNKIKLVPRIIEIISILHARPLGPPLAAPGTYIIVNRSVWESDDQEEGEEKGPANNGGNNNNNQTKMVRSEMLLAVQLLRPLNGGKHCEITTITHALAPGLNKTVAKTAANVTAAKIIRDIQAVHKKKL